MLMSSYSLSSISPSQLSVHQRWIESIRRIVHALIWSLMTATLLLTTLTVLWAFPLFIQNFPRLLVASFPAVFTDMTHAPLLVIAACISALCGINMFIFKQTRQSYQELHVWMVQIRIQWPGPRGTWHTLTLRHLTLVWGSIRHSAIGLRILCVALFQCLALLEQRIRHTQPISPSGTLAVLTDHQTTAVAITTISEECVSSPCCEEQPTAPINTGIFGSVLASGLIRVVGPTGKEQVIDVGRRPYRLLWLYLAAFFFTRQQVCVGDILRDVYDDSDERDVHEKEKLSNLFHRHCSTLRKEINAALREVGLPETDPLCNERFQKTSFWRLADTIQFQDLTLLADCKPLLATVKDQPGTALHEQTATACEQLCQVIGDLAPLKNDQETPGIRQLLREALTTSSQALRYLAEKNQMAVQQSTEKPVQDQFLRKEGQYWSIYALLCAHFASTFPQSYQFLSRQGELTLRKALSCCQQLRDQDRAIDLYQEYREAKEQDGGRWKPEAETKQRWREVLSTY